MTTFTRAITAAALLSLAATPAAAQDDFRWSGRLEPGQSIEIKNANGPLFAELAEGDEVEVVAVKEGPRRDREEVRIEVVEHAGGVTICAVYPGGWLRSNSCEPGDGGRISSNDNDTEVTFEIKIPAGVRYLGNTMNGRVAVDGLRSDVEVLTMNGAVSVETTGWARARTMNGAVEVVMGSADWTGDMEISTMNGRIEVTLPAEANVEIDAKTMNGSIDSDFPVRLSGWIRNHAEGTIGDGGRGLELSTMNGSIRIRRS